ncbi:MAG: helix-turn-helix domain-containing protein [Candidatus Bathyarchaeia archaeon]
MGRMDKRSYLLLRRMGLTDYEASAYLALTAKPRLTAKAVSLKTKVPITRLYGSLDSLSEKGFVKAYPGRPRLYEAVPPDKAVQLFMEYKRREFEEDLSKVKAVGEELSREIENDYWRSLKVKPEEVMKALPSLRHAEVETAKLIEGSEDCVYVLTAVFGWLRKVRNHVEEAVNRGVEFKALMLSPEANPEDLRREVPAENFYVRSALSAWYPMRCTIVDRRKAVLILWTSTNKETFWNPIAFKPYLTFHPGVVGAVSDMFEKMWNESGPLRIG